MRRRDFTWSIALCASVAAHAALIRWRADQYVEEHSGYRLAGYDAIQLALASKSPIYDADELGDSHGTGIATDASVGEQPMEATKAEQEQSFLSRDPQRPGTAGAKPTPLNAMTSEQSGDQGQNGSQSTQQAFGVQQAARAASPRFASAQQPPQPVAPPAPLPKVPSNSPPNRQTPDTSDGPVPKPSPPTPTEAATVNPPANPPVKPAVKPPDPTPAQTAVASAAATPSVLAAIAGRPGATAAPADPAPQADTESDPFSTVGSLEFRAGKTTVRMGRKHRVTRPTLPWDAQYDFFGMTHSLIVLDLQIDPTGQVISAIVTRSSGSDGVDQACRVAAYQWWFEPAKDAAGHAVHDEITFTIKFM